MNIQKDIKAILSGEYKQFHRAWLFSLILIAYFFSPIPVSASINEPFDCGGTIADWTVSGGGTYDNDDATGSWNNTGCNFVVVSGDKKITQTVSDVQIYPYFAVKMNRTGTGTVYYRFFSNAAVTQYTSIWWDGTGINFGSNTGATITVTTGVSNSKWMLIEATLNQTAANTVSFKITHMNGSVIYDNSASYTKVSGGNDVLIGTSTAAGSRFDDVIASVVAPSSSNSISWDAETYIEGGAQTLTWVLTDSTWDSIWTKKVRLYKEGVANEAWTSCVLGICQDLSYMILNAQTGSAPLHLTYGNYRIDLIEGLLSETVLDTASMRVLATAPSQMIVNNGTGSVPSRVSFIVWNNVGYSFAAGQIMINVEHKIDGNWILEKRVQVSTTQPASTPVTVNGVGEYRFTLYDIIQGINLISKLATANAVDMPIQINISFSNLTIDKTNYYYRDIMQGYFAIDNNNWTNGNTPYIAVRNTTGQIISAVFKNILGEEQQKTFMLIVGDGNEIPTNKFRPGNNTLELHSFNTTNDRLLASVYFNLYDTDTDGNKLRTDKYKYCPSDQVLIIASIPLQGNLTIVNYKDMGKILYSQPINGSDQSIIFKTSVAGDYLIRLIDNTGKQLRAADFVVSKDCAVATPTTTPEAGIKSGQEAADLLSSKIFWAFLIIVGVMMFIATKTKEYIPAGIAGITGLGIFTFMGWVPAWIFFTVLVVTAYLLAKQQTKEEG